MTVMRRLALAIAVILVSVACGTDTPAAVPGSTPPPTSSPPATTQLPSPERVPVDNRPRYEGFDDALSEHNALVAMTRGETEVFAGPSQDEEMLTMPWTTILGTVTVLTVVGEPNDGWAEVMLPVRPNGTTGWVRTDDVQLYLVQGKVVVDLSDRQLSYLVDGEEVLTTTVAIGTERNPTPTGSFFVTDSVTLANPDSPWGPHALGLSARSDTITEFNGGDGIIGIHGTNRPSTIGAAASLGCVRLPNDVITALHEMVPIGTPVEIRA